MVAGGGGGVDGDWVAGDGAGGSYWGSAEGLAGFAVAWRGLANLSGGFVGGWAVAGGEGDWGGADEECFGATCYSVTSVNSVEEFKGQGRGNLVQVGLRVRNGGKDFAGVDGIRAYLVDANGREWGQTRGVGGVALTIALPAGGETVSVPVFRVDSGARGLGLVLTRGYAGWGWLTIGDTDSLEHRRTALRLE